MTDQETWRPFKELSPEEQRAFLERVGEPHRDYEPIHPGSGTNWRNIGRKIWAPFIAVGAFLLKFGAVFFKLNFVVVALSMLVSIGGYALLWGWQFGVGFVALIFCHEMGHVLEARRQGLPVTAPLFIPFLGAMITMKEMPHNAWREAQVALAGPLVGSLAAAACWGIGAYTDSNFWRALAFAGFFINLFNLIPIVPLDGGRAVAALHPLRLGARARGARGARLLPAEPVPRPDPVPRRARGLAALAQPPRRGDAGVLPGEAGPASRRRGRLPRPRRRARARDGRDPGAALSVEEHHLDAIRDEFLRGFEAVERIDRPAVTFFGSARAKEGSVAYDGARDVGRLFAEKGFAVVTGGGPGVMEAGNRGCKEGGGLSVGFNIELPHEQGTNPYLDISLALQALLRAQDDVREGGEGFVIFPGGFGTLDELFESLTLIQTGTIAALPDRPLRRHYWQELLRWTQEELLAHGMISAEDLDPALSHERPGGRRSSRARLLRARAAPARPWSEPVRTDA